MAFMATVTISVSLDPEIAEQMRKRLAALGNMGQSEYVGHLIRNDLLVAGAPFQITVQVPASDRPKRKKSGG
jgi:hypothetical protein